MNLMRSSTAIILFGLLLAYLPSAAGQTKSTGNPRYDAAVARGVAALKSNVMPGKTPAGPLVLSAYALFKAGEPVESPIVQAGLNTVLGSVTTTGFHPHVAYDHLYESGLYSMFLADVNGDKYKPQIQEIANYVASVQRGDGSWADTPIAAADVSMCQYAVLSLWAAQRAGCTVSPEALDKTAAWHLDHRNSDGGWTYRPGTSIGTTGANSSRNMTMAAISSLGVTRLLFYGPKQIEKKEEPQLKFGVLEKAEDPLADRQTAFPEYNPQHSREILTSAIEKGLAYETANFNPININPNFPIYFYYSAERALSVSEVDSVAGREWFSTYADGLLTLQKQDGAWNETFSGDIIGTSFAILYLKRSTKQIIDKTYGLGLQRATKAIPLATKKSNANRQNSIC